MTDSLRTAMQTYWQMHCSSSSSSSGGGGGVELFKSVRSTPDRRQLRRS